MEASELINDNPTFVNPGEGPGKLQTRPKYYVPINVPVYNELATLEAQNALTQARRDGVEGLPESADPVYHWFYRPEMQFSVYDLQNQMLQVQPVNDDIQLIDLSAENSELLVGSLLSGDINYAELLYDLTGSDIDPLEYFSGNHELIFALGAEEAQATITSDGVVRFDNPEHLFLLDESDYLTISLYQNNDAGNTLWEFGFVTKLSVNTVREADNFCNVVPNRSQIEVGYGDSLIVATESEKANHVEVSLDGVIGDRNNLRIRVEGNGQWIEADHEECLLCKGWKVSFDVPDIEEDTTYTLYTYEDTNENNKYDEGENLEILNYRSGDFNILVASESGYGKHLEGLLRHFDLFVGTTGVGYELINLFLNGAPAPSGYQNLVYQNEEVGTIKDTLRDDYLVNAWAHGAGAEMRWIAGNSEKCDSVVPYYTYAPSHPLHDAVMQSDEFHTRLENIERNKSFEKDRFKASACSNGDNCVEFITSDIDNDLTYIKLLPPLPLSVEANLAAALGQSKFTYSAKVRYKDNIIFDDEYDIKITGEIYDMYDFAYGKDSFLGAIDLNTDGAVIQLGYERKRGVRR